MLCHIIVDDFGVAFGQFAGFGNRLLELGRFAVDDRPGQHVVDKGDLRLVGDQQTLFHGDFDVAAKYPKIVVEVQVRGALWLAWP